jgi:manganese/zinc/iron transport system permease protein
VACILFIRNLTRLKEDTALGIVLSVFFGAGVALLGVVQQMRTGHAAGLESFIYGKTASMIASDAYLIGGAALVCAATCGVLFKELKALCFDEGFARSRGLPVVPLDMILMALVVTVVIIGLQAVGLVLVIALLVTPAAAARFWTERLSGMVVIAALLGAASCMTGAAMSAILPRLPSGAMIVLVGTAFFLVSMGIGPARGVAVRVVRRIRLNSRVDRRHLLRGVFELLEARGGPETSDGIVTPEELLQVRSWSPGRLRRLIRRAERAGLVRGTGSGSVRLTEEGFRVATRLAREHRLWELYLITYADVAPALVDRDADAIEHVLGPELVQELESLLERNEASGIPSSPHPIRFADRAAGRREP